MKISIPDLCLIILIGPSGCGKSSFGRKYFKTTEVISSDFCRGLVSDDENDQGASRDAFDLVRFIAAKRLAAGKLTVIDATNVNQEERRDWVELARKYDCLCVSIAFNIRPEICHERNVSRPDRAFGAHVVRRQHSAMRRSLYGLGKEGFRFNFVLDSPEEVDRVTIERTPLWTNLTHEHGPFDIIGDVHGCYAELKQLLLQLGYQFESDGAVDNEAGHPTVRHPEGRKAVFVGDLVDRGPQTPAVLRLVMRMCGDGHALCVAGNHDSKLARKLKGRSVQITHGLAESIEQMEKESAEFNQSALKFLDKLISHYVLDDGNLVVAHAGMKSEYQGRASSRVRDFAMYGETTGETDEYGLPVRYNWAQDYRGKAMVVYGHTPTTEPGFLNRTICLDTGCVFGGRLTALRYPEKELVSVDAAAVYYKAAKPLGAGHVLQHCDPDGTADGVDCQGDVAAAAGVVSTLVADRDGPAIAVSESFVKARGETTSDILDIDDVSGRRTLNTRFHRNITIRQDNAAAALEVMSRFAVNPKWLFYLPPTMSPCGTTNVEGLLEHPVEAFNYYSDAGETRVICEEKHMGSRAVVIICKDEAAASARFGVANEGRGICFTRTGRRFFNDAQMEAEFLARLHADVERAGLYDELQTSWLALDCELMPWSAKALELIRDQYAAVGAAATTSLSQALDALTMAKGRGADVDSLLTRYGSRRDSVELFRQAYRRYCWPVNSLDDIKLAPFHLLACEGKAFFDKSNEWHMSTLARIAETSNGLVLATPYRVIELDNQDSIADGIEWWQNLTQSGGEGMVVKSYDFLKDSPKGILQPAIKCRGKEYLRIIYGPEYTAAENLQRLRKRGLSAKRSLAYREFLLGVEAVERFVRCEPLYRVHECVFGVLALESEPVDPRL